MASHKLEIENTEREYVNIDQSATMTNIQQQQTILSVQRLGRQLRAAGIDGHRRPSSLPLSPRPHLFEAAAKKQTMDRLEVIDEVGANTLAHTFRNLVVVCPVGRRHNDIDNR